MVALATFAASDAGKTYAYVSSHFGVDPAASFADDFVAFNLRAALVLAMNADDEPGEEDKGDPDTFKRWIEANGG